ncbi:MAG TPA: FkbM family methyltransferase [Candidatus Udaeobacter sp.]|nr:FkbM family methyltransferase [Candidatus Udaeobacter sp.]
MKIGRLLPGFIKDPVTRALSAVLNSVGVDFLRDYVHRRQGIGNAETEELTGEKFLIEHVLPRLLDKEPPVMFDVGANVGHYSKALYSAFPKAQIVAFEPVPRTFEALRATLVTTTVKCCSIGLSDAVGDAIIYDYDEVDGSEHASLFPGVLRDLHRAKTIKETKVPLITLDAYCCTASIPVIDFLKIDTEGNDLKVLKGSQAMIQKNAIRVIQFEFNQTNIFSRVFLKDFYEILRGYSFYRLLPHALLPLGSYSFHNEIFAFQNILALNDALIGDSLVAPFVSCTY